MKQLPLSDGTFALVDDDDFERASKYKWRFRMRKNGKISVVRGQNLTLHRLIIKTDLEVINKNKDPRDFRKENLIVGTRQNTCSGVRRSGRNKSGYKGVTWDFDAGKWFACISLKNRTIYLGRFKNKIDAAKAYDLTARRLFGQFARLNFPLDGEMQA